MKASTIWVGIVVASVVASIIFWILFATHAALGLPYVTAPKFMEALRVTAVAAPYAFVAAVAHGLVLGLPLFLLLKKLGRINCWSSAGVGLLIGAIPTLVFGWPSSSKGFSYSARVWGEVRELIVEGVPTVWGWINYGETIAIYGVCGAGAGIAFWTVWRRLENGDAPLKGMS